MFIIGYGISMDVEDLPFAVLDRDQTTTSRDYALNLACSRYFIERAPISNYTELDERMRNGELSLIIEIPPGFARDLRRGTPVEWWYRESCGYRLKARCCFFWPAPR